MLNFLPAPLIGLIAMALMALNALFWEPILLLFALLKLFITLRRMRLLIDPLLLRIAEARISGNSGCVREAHQKWVQQLWREKDAQIEALIYASNRPVATVLQAYETINKIAKATLSAGA